MTYRPRSVLTTHEVTNQPAGRADIPLTSPILIRAVQQWAPAHAAAIDRFAAEVGSPAAQQDAREAQINPPRLVSFDRGGRRLDEVAFHPGYHAMMARGQAAGYAALPWTEDATGGHVAHAALNFILSQVEPGVCCPLTMTYAVVPALAADPALAAAWVPGALSRQYDGRSLPAPQKTGLTFGMAMTEKQGGSDVRANSTRAQPDGEGWRLTGHKWFCSAPMSDAFLTLAQTDAGLSCFLVPRWTPDGQRNPFHLMRLKDKLGNKANASSEIEYHHTWAQILGAPGEGVKRIIEMVHHTRLDCAIAPAGFMQRALDEALWWANNRLAFQRRLIDQPLMRMVLADLTIETQAATALALRLAHAFDQPDQRAFSRIAVAIGKYWNNKRCAPMIAEAMECLGGMGYIEDTPMPMLYREAPLNAIWEGSGNVICLDVLRTLARVPEAGAALIAELTAWRGCHPDYDRALELALTQIQKPEEAQARQLVERLGLLLQAAALMALQSPLVDAYCHTRLGDNWGHCFGTLPADLDAGAILAAA